MSRNRTIMKIGKQTKHGHAHADDSSMTPKVVLSSFGFKIKNRIYRQHFEMVPCIQTGVNVLV